MFRESYLKFDMFGLEWVAVRNAPGGKFDLEARYYGGDLPAIIGPAFDDLESASMAKSALNRLAAALEAGVPEYDWRSLRDDFDLGD